MLSLLVVLAGLSNITCHEEITRFSQSHNNVQYIDTVAADIEVIGGTERYSWIHSGVKRYKSFRKLGGAWSYGEFSTILSLTAKALAAKSDSTFHLSELESEWTVTIDSKVYTLPFTGTVRTTEAGALASIHWESDILPKETEIGKVAWDVEFEPVRIAGREYLTPHQARYAVTYPGRKRIDFNITEFSNFRRYGAETNFITAIWSPIYSWFHSQGNESSVDIL